MEKVKSKILIVIALCIAMLAGIGLASFVAIDKKVSADSSDYFLAVEKYSLPTKDEKPDVAKIINDYNDQHPTNKLFIAYLYDPTTGDFLKESENNTNDGSDANGNKYKNYISTAGNETHFNADDSITLENITNLFVSQQSTNADVTYVNFVTFLRNNKYKNKYPYLSQTLQTNDPSALENLEGDIKNIAMLESKTDIKDYIIMSFMPTNMKQYFDVGSGFDWNDNSARFQTLGVSATLNDESLKAQNGYQDFTSTHKFFARATNLENLSLTGETKNLEKENAQGHFSFEFTFTNANGATTPTKPTMDFYVLDKNYYASTDTNTPKLENVNDVVERDKDTTNTLKRNKKEYSYFNYTNTSTKTKIDYPTVTYDPTRYTLAFYFVDRSQDTGNLDVVTSQLENRKIDDKYQLYVVLSNGEEYKVEKDTKNANYIVKIAFENLGSYMLDFDFAFFKIDETSHLVENFLPQGDVKATDSATLTRTNNWDRVREDNSTLIGTDNLTIYGYQLFYSDYANDTDSELKNTENGYYADVTNANSDNLNYITNIMQGNDAITSLENLGHLSIYGDVPSTNQPPLSLKYGANQTLLNAYYKRYAEKGGELLETVQIDNMSKIATTGVQSEDNGYYELFVTYKLNSWKKETEPTPKTQVFAFVVNYATPNIEFYTYDTEISFDLEKTENVKLSSTSGIAEKLTITFRGSKFSRTDINMLTFASADGKTLTFADDTYTTATYTYKECTYATLNDGFEDATTLNFGDVTYTLATNGTSVDVNGNISKTFANGNRTFEIAYDSSTGIWTGTLTNNADATITEQLIGTGAIVTLVDSSILTECKQVQFGGKVYSRTDTSTNIFKNDVDSIAIDDTNKKFVVYSQTSTVSYVYTQNGTELSFDEGQTITLSASTVEDSNSLGYDSKTFEKYASGQFVFIDSGNQTKIIISINNSIKMLSIATETFAEYSYTSKTTATTGSTTIVVDNGKATYGNFDATSSGTDMVTYNNLTFEINRVDKKLKITRKLGDTTLSKETFSGYGFTNKNVLVDWSHSLEIASPFDIAPTITIDGMKIDNDATNGKYKLKTNDNTYKKFDVKIEWGPTNDNRSNKKYELTIDKTKILDYVAKFDATGNQIANNVVAINADTFRVAYGEKDSGADITMTYTLLPIENSVSIEADGTLKSNGAITNGKAIQSLLSNNSYEPQTIENGKATKNYMPSTNGIFVLNFADSAGNTATQYVLRDQTSPTMLYKLANDNGNFENADWNVLSNASLISRTDVLLDRGDYKAILIDTEKVGKINISDDNIQVATVDDKTYLLVKMDKISMNTSTTNPISYTTRQYVFEATEGKRDIQYYISSFDVLENNSSVGKLTISFDNVKLQAVFNGNYPTSYRQLGKMAPDVSSSSSSIEDITASSGEYSTRQYMKLSFEASVKNYIVSKVVYDYYPFALDSDSTTNTNYPFAQNPSAQSVFVFDASSDSTATGTIVSSNLNLESGNSLFAGSGTATKQGLYVVTRYYNHDRYIENPDPKDPEVSTYYFYIDRQGIVSRINANKVVGGNIKIRMGANIGNTKDESLFEGQNFLQDLNADEDYVLTTSKQPIQLAVPLTKYEIAGIAFENISYGYDESNTLTQTKQKIFFAQNLNAEYDSGNFILMSNGTEYDGTYSVANRTIALTYKNGVDTTNLPQNFAFAEETATTLLNCMRLSSTKNNKTTFFNQIRQNILSYKIDVVKDGQTKSFENSTTRLTGNFVADKTLATANTNTQTDGAFEVLIADISLVKANLSDCNKLSFAFNVGLRNPQATFTDESGIGIAESANEISSTNKNTTRLQWDSTNKNDYDAHIDPNNISVTQNQYIGGQIVSSSFSLESKAVKSNATNSYIEFSDASLEQTTGTSKQYVVTLRYKNASKYGAYQSVKKTINFDYDKPNFNYSILKNNDMYFALLSVIDKANFDDYSSKINFENYAFVVGSDWSLRQPTFENVLATNSYIANDLLYYDSDATKIDNNDVDKVWYRQYDKSYNSTSAIQLQSIVPGDDRYSLASIPNYKFDPDLTNSKNEKIYSEYEFGTTSFVIGNYYEIIEKDIAGNYRIYTIYVAKDNATIDYVNETGESATLAMAEENASYEINIKQHSALKITNIDGLGDFYQVTVQNVTSNSAVTTLTKTNGENITNQINNAISNVYDAENSNGNNILIVFYTARGTYTINYRTPGNVNISYNTVTNSLTFVVDRNAGSYIKSLNITLNDVLVYNLGDSDMGKPFTITQTSSANKTTCNIKFAIDGTSQKLVFEYADNFDNVYRQFVLWGIQNTNFDLNANDSSANMLIFGQNSGSSTTKLYDLKKSENNHTETTYIAESDTNTTNNEAEPTTFAKYAMYYTGSDRVTFRYQTKVYSNVKIYAYGEDGMIELKNLYSSTDAETYIRTVQIYNNKSANVDDVYVIQFQDPIGNKYEYVIHHYTKLAEIAFKNDNGDKIEIGNSLVETKEKLTISVTDQPDLYQTTLSATRVYVDNNGITQTENISDIASGYSFTRAGTYTITATNGIGTTSQYIFSYVGASSAIYTITSTTTDGVTKVLAPSKSNKYNYNGTTIDQYFALLTSKIDINVANGYSLTQTSVGTNAQNTAKTIIYTIADENNKSTYTKSFAVTQVVASTDLILGKMKLNGNTVLSRTQSTQSTANPVTLQIPNYFGIKSNKLLVRISFGDRDLGFVDGILSEDETTRTYTFAVAGEYVISVSDQAGNVHLFNGTTPNFELLVLNNVTYTVNGQDPIQNAYYNTAVDLVVTNITKFFADEKQPYVTEVVMLNNKQIDTTRYSRTKNSTAYSYRFSEYGSYVITFTAYIGSVSETNKITTTASFTIINQNESRKLHEYIGLNGYEITSIVKDNTDITSQIKQSQGVDSLTKFAIFGGSDSSVVGGNGKYTITVNAYLGELIGSEDFSYNVWINDDANAIIESSIAPGSSTTKSIMLQMNLYQIYSEVGECTVKLNGGDYITINANSASQNTISTYELTANKTYNVTVVTSSGNTILSFVVTKKEPLNTVAIIVIVVVSVVAVALTVTFILFRKKMKVR